MMRLELIGDDHIRAALLAYGRNIERELDSSMAFIVLRLQKHIRTHKLLGQVLNRRTGNLRANIIRRVEKTDGQTVGIVGIGKGAPYGKLHEYGYSGTQTVAAHIRTQKTAWGKRLKTPVQVRVSAHTRRVNLPERSFMRTALADMAPLIEAELTAAVKRSLR
ncbi:MAG: HK97 gp10 family phage protein [Eikenella sp.]|nr:HK97 gp10 family phage protein [Eikenella sp.]